MKFVIISSKRDITVTNGLVNVDKTNYSSRISNTLNIAPLWTRNAVHIHKDKGAYPAEIAEWPTVKALEESNIFTIGQFTDTGTEEELRLLEEFNASTEEVKAELENAADVEEEAAPKRRRKKSEEAAAE